MSARLKELRQKQEKIVVEARSRLEEITACTDETRAKELEAQHDAAMAEHDKLEKEIKQIEQVIALETHAEEQRSRQRPLGPDLRSDDRAPTANTEYRSAFYKMLANGGDISALSGEERNALKAGIVTPDQEQRSQSTVAAAGGYTVPTELAGFIIQSMKEWGPMYDENVCTEMRTARGNPITIPTVDDTDKEAVAHTEGNDFVDDGSADVEFSQKLLSSYVFNTKFVKFSFELVQDSAFGMEQLLGSLLGERLGRIANLQLTRGTGVNAPNGIVTASSLGRTTATATGVTWDDIIDLEHSVDPAYRASPKARYMFNDKTLNIVRKLKDGDGNYLWQKGDVQKGVPGSFNGRPYSINQAMDDIAAAKKFMLFGDFSKYFVRKVNDPMIGIMRERFWPNLGIAGLIRFDGELGDAAAVKHMAAAA
ncbi:phage major capsid protein [Brucella sp. TWI559]